MRRQRLGKTRYFQKGGGGTEGRRESERAHERSGATCSKKLCSSREVGAGKEFRG